MLTVLINLCLLAVCAEAIAAGPGVETNPMFSELLEKGVRMSDGRAYKLPAPAMADALDAAGQKAAMEKISGGRYTFDDLVQKTTSAPVMIRMRTLKAAEGESATIRAIDVWFVAHGKWETMNSKDFQDSLAKGKDTEGENRIVSKSGILTDEEMQKRKLKLETPEGQEAKFVYTTFSLFDQVEVSATRYAVVTRDKNFLLAAARIDGRFDNDADYPNQWRPILRDAARISAWARRSRNWGRGLRENHPACEPADAIFVEGHMVFEEPYGWFEGGNVLRSKAPAMIQQRAKIFRSKFAIATQKRNES